MKDLPLAITALTVIALVGGAGVAGVNTLAAEAAPEQVAPATVRTADWRTTPAYAVIDSTLSTPPEGWAPQAEPLYAAAAPFPTSCMSDLDAGAVSASRSFLVGESPVTLTLIAHGAGLGAAQYQEVLDAVDDCGGVSVAGDMTLGVEGVRLDGGTQRTPTAISQWRRGDVLAYLSAPGGSDIALLSAAADVVLASQMSGVCVNEASVVSDAVRTPWYAPEEFAGLLTPETVSIPALNTPPAPVGSATTVVPGPAITLASITRPRTPSYPVWPPLPAEVSRPAAPEAPVAPETSQVIQVRVSDADGPGCGWDFTATAAPFYDEDAAAQKADTDRSQTTALLTDQANKWTSDVTAYYAAYQGYADAAGTYQQYVDQVASVTAAWNVIADQWADYRSAKSRYDAAVDAAETFATRQQQAQQSYDAGVLACAAPASTETITVTPSPTSTSSSTSTSPVPGSTPSPTTSPSASATSTPTPTTAPSPTTTTRIVPPPACPQRPEILDQQAPSVPNAPSPPADPRPVDAR